MLPFLLKSLNAANGMVAMSTSECVELVSEGVDEDEDFDVRNSSPVSIVGLEMDA